MRILPGSKLKDEAWEKYSTVTCIRARLASAIIAVGYWVTPREHTETTQKHEVRRLANVHDLTIEEESEVYDE